LTNRRLALSLCRFGHSLPSVRHFSQYFSMFFRLGYCNQTQALGREFTISSRRFHLEIPRSNCAPDNPTKSNSAIVPQSQPNPKKSNLTIERCDPIGVPSAPHNLAT
jgi:hypothetical protein